jgi:hypothetical protein
MATTPINSKVSPALDPETYKAVEGYDDSTRGYVDDVVSVFQDIYGTVGKLHAARALADSNPAWGEEQKLLIVGAEAAKQKERLAQRLDRASRDLASRIVMTEGELSKPLAARAVGSISAEIRAHAKGLSSAERSKLVREAIEAGDEDTVASILGSPAFLSGITPLDQTHYTREYNVKKQPHLVARLDLMTRVRDTMDRTGAHGPVFHSAFEKAVGAKPNDVRAIEQANRLAVDALKIEPTV